MKKLWLCALALVVSSSVSQAQTPAAADEKLPAFDVISVKPSGTDDGRMMWSSTPDGVKTIGVPLALILQSAFGVEEDQIVGAPDWVKSARFDIDGKVSAEDLDRFKKLKGKQRGEMMQSILVERFGLKFHNETRELPVYELQVAKGGPKLKEAELLPADAATNKPARGKGQMQMQPGKIKAMGVQLSTLAGMLSGRDTGRTVVDKTGLTGYYDFTLEWTPEGGMMINGAPAPPPPPGSPAEANLFSAVQEQLGLKLEARKDMLPVIVIDHIEKPSVN